MSKPIYQLLILMGLILFSSCEKKNNEIPVKDYLEISTQTVTSDYLGKTELIQIEASSEWDIFNDPKWCIIEKINQNNKRYLEIIILPNDTTDVQREVELLIATEQITKKIHIKQFGKKNEPQKEKTEKLFLKLPVNKFDVIPIIENEEITGWNVKAFNTFINPSIKEHIYIGSIINSKLSNPSKVMSYNDQEAIKKINFTGNPGTKNSQYSTNVKPSKEETENLAQKVIRGYTGSQSSVIRFITTELPYYSSHEQLHMLGLNNLGIKLDELLFKTSYTKSEMQKKNGFIYDNCIPCFNIISDMPKKSEEAFKGEENILDLAIVNIITYGTASFLFVETDIDKDIAKTIIRKIIREEKLSIEEETQKREMDFYTLYFDKNTNPIINTGEPLFPVELPIIPLTFSLLDYNKYSVGYLKFPIKK